MSVSDDAHSERIDQQTLASLSRYDLVLALIPAVFLMSVVIGHLLSVPFLATLTGASAVGVLVLVDALFVNPPTRSTE